jgi:hypothetical protein
MHKTPVKERYDQPTQGKGGEVNVVSLMLPDIEHTYACQRTGMDAIKPPRTEVNPFRVGLPQLGPHSTQLDASVQIPNAGSAAVPFRLHGRIRTRL